MLSSCLLIYLKRKPIRISLSTSIESVILTDTDILLHKSITVNSKVTDMVSKFEKSGDRAYKLSLKRGFYHQIAYETGLDITQHKHRHSHRHPHPHTLTHTNTLISSPQHQDQRSLHLLSLGFHRELVSN